MWFRRRPRQSPLDLSSLERSLDRLMELVERIIALIPDLVAAQSSNRDPPAPEPVPQPELVPAPAPEVEGHVLFVGAPTGYALLERAELVPARGSVLDLDGEQYIVLRLGPSPLPADRRRCAFLEREERPPRG